MFFLLIYYTLLSFISLLFIFSPGLLLALWIFPDDPPLWKISIGGGLGVAIIGLIALSSSYLPFGITNRSIIAGVCLLNVIFMALLYRSKKYTVQRVWPIDWSIDFQLHLSIIIFLIFLMILPSLTKVRKHSYTEFYIVDQYTEPLPWQESLAIDEPVTITFAVVSSEHKVESFSVHLLTEGKVVQEIDIGMLNPGESATNILRLPARSQKKQKYEMYLYKDNLSTPYRTLYFWLKDLTIQNK